MKTPYISISLEKIEHNAKIITDLCKLYDVSVAGITKGTLGNPKVAEAMIRGGVKWIGESRLDNIERLKLGGINVPFLLIRSPNKSDIKRVVTISDISLNTEYDIIEELSQESIRQNKVHNIIIMVDTGDLREGVWPQDLIPLIRDVKKMKGVNILGLGTNLLDLNGIIPTFENNKYFVDIAEEAEEKCKIKFEYLSAGNSGSLNLLNSGNLPERINHFRIGEGILLGREPIKREAFLCTYQDAFILYGEIIEKKIKPSMPIGEAGQDAFGNKPIFEDRGIMTRIILNMGRQDINLKGLTPCNEKLEIIGASSDHLILDSSMEPDLNIGDKIGFNVNYAAMLASMTSPFVDKVFIS
jgi:predicted amino acid racemase